MKKIITILMCTAIFSVSLCSCKHNSTINGSSEISQADENTDFMEDSSFYTGAFNEEVFEHIIQNINLKGVKISMPCTLKDMGNGFEVSTPLFFEKYALTTYALNYKDVYLGQIVYYSDHELTEEELETEKFHHLCVSPSDLPFNNFNDINVVGVEFGSDYQEVERVLGQPTSKSYDDISKFYSYKLSEKKYIEFHFTNDSMYSININVE